jgi:hypothetical protein
MTTFIVNTLPDLQTALADLEDAVKVEVSPGVGILGKTVADLRQLTVLPAPIRVQIPRPLYRESIVKVRLPERASP